MTMLRDDPGEINPGGTIKPLLVGVADNTGPKGSKLPNAAKILKTALTLLEKGYRPAIIYPPGFDRGAKGISKGKEPFGPKWGVKDITPESIASDVAFFTERNMVPGVGACLGPGRAPGGGWLADLEGDGEKAEASLLALFGGKPIPTIGWGSRRGQHRLYRGNQSRLEAIASGLKPFQVVDATNQPGVFHIPSFPDLELRIGGFKPGGVVKQVQSVVPPTPGTDGIPRTWGPDKELADLPDSFYFALEAIVRGSASAPTTVKPQPPAANPAPLVVDPKGMKFETGNQADAYLRGTLKNAVSRIEGTGDGARRDKYRDEAYNLAGYLHYHERYGVGYSEAELSQALKGALAIGVSYGDPVVETTVTEAIIAGKLAPRDLKPDLDIAAKGGSVGSVGTTTPASAENEGGSVGSVGSPTQDIPKFEGNPRPITIDLSPIPVLPPAMIPDAFRGWIENVSRRGCFPIEYAAATAIVGTSSVIGRRLAIRPKRRDSWTVVPNLWGAAVGPPGIQKTPAVEETLRPLYRLVAEAIKAHEDQVRRVAEDQAIAEAKASAAKKKLSEAAKKGSPDQILRQLASEANAEDVALPTLKRYVVNDATVEKLGELLSENPFGLLQFRDELSGFLRSMDRQGHESDRGFYLETWNGNGTYTFDRIGRGTTHVKNLCLSLFGTIQPGPLARYLKGAASGEDADGFVPRFQVLVYPDAPKTFINVDEWPNADAKNRAYEVFRWIDSMQPSTMGAEHDDDSGLDYLRFDDNAQALFDEWRIDLENRLRGGSESPVLTCHLSKYRSLMPSLALIFHVVDSAGEERLEPVSHAAAEAAAAWCELLEAHARRVYQSASDGDPEIATRLAERIKQALPNPFTFRQVANKGWAGLDSVDDARRAVGILEDRGWVKVVTRMSPKGGRPSEEVWINPLVHKEGDQ